MKVIAEPCGSEVQLDPCDVDLLDQWRWELHSAGYLRGRRGGRKCERAYLHRLVLDACAGQIVDHINGDRLDNRRANLRLSNHTLNQANRHARTSRSGYKGVTWHKVAGKWMAQIKVEGRNNVLGFFRTPEEAAANYNAAATAAWGKYANLNEIPATCSDSGRFKR